MYMYVYVEEEERVAGERGEKGWNISSGGEAFIRLRKENVHRMVNGIFTHIGM